MVRFFGSAVVVGKRRVKEMLRRMEKDQLPEHILCRVPGEDNIGWSPSEMRGICSYVRAWGEVLFAFVLLINSRGMGNNNLVRIVVVPGGHRAFLV